MASIHKDPRNKSPFWYVAYRLPNGKRTFRSTKLTDQKAAKRYARLLDQAELAPHLTEARAREMLSGFVAHFTGEPELRNPTVWEWMSDWLKLKKQVRARKTMTRYEQVIENFLGSLGSRADLALVHISPRDILAYRDAIIALGKTACTANLSVKVVSAAFNAALRQHIIPHNPATALESLPVQSQERDTFTREQVQKLVQAAEGDWKGAILLAYFTGARLGDVANMQWNVIDWKEKTITFTPSKTKKPLLLPLHPQLERELRKAPGIGKAPMFPSLAGKDTGGRFGLSGRFAAIMEKAGIQGRQTPAHGGRVLSSLSFHSLRHTFASTMANAGVSPEVRMKLSGHRDKDVHATYTHHELETLRAAVAHIPSVRL